MRASGILLPVTSLPSRFGIGCFSKEAFAFVDSLKKAGQKYWQILPLGPTGYGDSPYQSFSTYAGNPYFIDLETLIEEGLLKEEECEACDFGNNPESVDYEKIYRSRFAVLERAYERFRPDQDYEDFKAENSFWLEDYCLYMAVKKQQKDVSWSEWPEELKNRKPEVMEAKKQELKREIGFYSFLQYLFSVQWKKLKAYANANGIDIIGDIPIYVAFDSADTWAHPELFQFDGENQPTAVAGCPPDAFSATGQLWGNPLYRWEYHKETGYEWWLRRIRYVTTLYDVVRIDHFRGFDEYYSIPYGDSTAENGHWEKGPGIGLFHAVNEKLGAVRVIAEDLGYLTQSVIDMVKESGYPGMKVLQFAFDSREESDYLPHNYEHNCVVYTGTHDNDTILGWYDVMAKQDREFSREYMNNAKSSRKELPWDFIRMAMGSVADLCMIPMQDYLGLGSEARMNYPSTLGGNWEWRMKQDAFTDELAAKIKRITQIYARCEKDEEAVPEEEQQEAAEKKTAEKMKETDEEKK